jgi:outer membrane immunogenic protein
MRKTLQVLLTAGALALGASAAQAADFVEAVPEEFDWSGWYIGGNVGYAFSGDDEVGVSPGFGEVGDLELEGLFGGAQIGANWQRNNWVFGIEADIQLTDIDDSDTNTVGGVIFDSESNVDWFSTIRGRAGFAANRWFFYGTGGVAIGGIDYEVTGDNGINISDDYTEIGWTAGGGVEWAWSESISSKVEYLYVNLGEKEIDDDEFDVHTHATPDFHSVRFGLNFRF